MATTTAISLEEYLHGPIPDPDVEFVDGELKGKSLVYSIHGRLQSIISNWFEARADEWGVVPAPEVRVQVAESRVRLPDVVVDKAGPWPPTLIEPPLIVIEILSPSDSFTDLTGKLREYDEMGVANIWVIDPQARRSWAYEGVSLVERSRLAVASTAIYLDAKEIFARYDRYQTPRA